MRVLMPLLVFLTALASAQSGSQSTTTAKPSPAAKSATATKSATAAKPASANPAAIIDTTAGKMNCTLFPDKAPIGVDNFIGLATGKKDWKNPVSGATKHGVPLYDGTIFHRVIPEFMIQGGDPAGNGSGDPGYKFKNEVSTELLFDRPGRLAYANSGPDTNGSQFFITEDSAHSRHLSGHYTIFGQCDDATVELVKQIARMARDPQNDRPFRPVKINHISIVKAGTAPKPAGTAAKKPAASSTAPKPAPKPAPGSN
ncbi:MAG TPA: peptidylprolyl isomerase [Candidatus Sulfotelmatobacter sp.]|nr:peptidylprolyl isomerase [Candidatus Sulfotelmatobacter sp.]